MKTKRIERLTKVQESELQAAYDRALASGRSTEPADRPATESAITEMYALLNKPRPVFVWLDSPWAVCVAGRIVDVLLKDAPIKGPLRSQLGSQLRSQLRSQLGSQLEGQLRIQLEDQLRSQLGSQLGIQLGIQLWSQLEGQLRSQLGSQLRSQLRSQLGSQLGIQLGIQLWIQLEKQLRSQLGSQLRSQLRSQLGSQLEGQLRSQLEGQLRSQLGSQLRSQLGSQLEGQLGLMFWGQHELAWMTIYEFGGHIGVKYDPKDINTLSLWLRIGHSSAWWQPRNGIALLSDRACELHLDDEGRMHNPDGAAMKFRDGYSVWSIGGVLVDEQIIQCPETQTVKQIKSEKNEEVKRIRIERFGGKESDAVDGWKRYLSEIKAKVVEDRRNDIDGTREALVKTPDGMSLMLVACCSTARRYALEVPSEISTCEQAQNYMRSGSWLDRIGLKRRCIDAA